MKQNKFLAHMDDERQTVLASIGLNSDEPLLIAVETEVTIRKKQ